MEYGNILRRSWDIILKQKYLIILGVLASLGGSNGGSSNWQMDNSSGDDAMPSVPMDGFNFETLPFDNFDWLWLLPVAGLIALIGFAIIIGILIWVVSVLAHGGLIVGVNGAEEGQPMSFGSAWSAAWSEVWRLLGISLVPAVPMLIFLGLGIGMFFSTVGLAAADLGEIASTVGIGFASLAFCLVCLLIPVWIVLEFLRIFAMRACLLEETGVIDSYRRGIEVIRSNGTEFIALFLLRVGVGIALFVVLFLPGLAMTVCCILWPLLLLVRGFIAAYFSAMWTLAWREWTVHPPDEPTLPDTPMVA